MTTLADSTGCLSAPAPLEAAVSAFSFAFVFSGFLSFLLSFSFLVAFFFSRPPTILLQNSMFKF
jgi:hypothetical protein